MDNEAVSSATVSLRDFTVSSEFNVHEVEDCLRKWGAAVLPGWLTGVRLEGLRGEFSDVFDDENPDYIYRFGYESGRGVSIDFQKLLKGRYPFIESIFQNSKMADLAETYVGHPYILNYEIYATHETNGGGIVAPAHFDKLWTLKFMIYLQDVEEGNAPFGVIPGSATFARNRFRRLFEDNEIKVLSTQSNIYQEMANDQIPESVGNVVDILAPAGSLIVFDTDTCHRAGYLAEGKERKILRGHSGPSAAYSEVRRKGRQWWRGERGYSRWQDLFDRFI